jgi:hypothetical protein
MCPIASIEIIYTCDFILTLSTYVETAYGPLSHSLEESGGVCTEVHIALIKVAQIFVGTSPPWPDASTLRHRYW